MHETIDENLCKQTVVKIGFQANFCIKAALEISCGRSHIDETSQLLHRKSSEAQVPHGFLCTSRDVM